MSNVIDIDCEVLYDGTVVYKKMRINIHEELKLLKKMSCDTSLQEARLNNKFHSARVKYRKQVNGRTKADH